MPKHVVRPGEGLSSIADQYGLFPLTIWDHPDNADLRAAREDPDILAPGDCLFVPERRAKSIARPTDQRHRFLRRGVPALLRLQVFVGAELRANQPYSLIIDGAARGGVTDGDGVLQVDIPPRSQRAILEIGPDNHRFEIRLGHIDPITTLPGVRTRLHNLGFPCGSATDPADRDLHAALRAFQRFADLAETDDWRDPATRDALLRLHDSREWQPAEEGELEEILDEDDEDDEPPPVAAAPRGLRQT